MTDDDQVARASGPSGRVLLAEVVETGLSAAECSVIVASRASGAVVTFEGVVRDHDGGRDVAFGEAGARRLDGDAVADGGGRRCAQPYGGIDIGGGLFELAEIALGRRPEQQQGRLAVDDRAEAGQQPEQGRTA